MGSSSNRLLLVLIGLCLLNFIDIGAEKFDAGTSDLIFAHVLFRHGDRTPIDPYPTDPWRSLKYWPVGYGQLTNTGKNQHYALGKWLRKRYQNLVNQTYSKDEVYVRSTDVDRTLMSALANMAGFYPPAGDQVWNENLHWQPVPVHTIPEKQDHVLAGKKSCPAYDLAIRRLRRSDEYRKLDEKYRDLYKYLTENTGREVSSLEGVQNLYNCLMIEKLYNRSLPAWTDSVYPGDMAWISSRAFATQTFTPEMAHFKIGPLLNEMLIRFSNKTLGKLNPNRSLWIYSGHDVTVANLLNALGLFEYHNPPYAACVMIELRLVDGNPLVSIFYKNTTAEPKPLFIPKCGTACPLTKMFDLYDSLLPKDWEAECEMSVLSMTYEEADIATASIVTISSVLVVILIIVMVGGFYRRREYRDARWYLNLDR